MIGVFRKHPGLGLLSVIGVLLAGVVLAHRSGSVHLPRPSLSLRRDAAQAPVARYAQQLDLAQARLVGDHLEQRLDDGTIVSYTLDPVLQKKMSEYFTRHEVPYAAAVAYRIDSGELLAMVGVSARDEKLDAQKLCLSPWAPAASIFKLVTASGLLDHGVPPSTTVCYHGGLSGLRAGHLEDNPRLDTSCRTLSDAVAKSINPIIGKLSLRYLDRGSLLAWAERYGFNERIPFELPIEPSHAKVPAERVERARMSAGFWHSELSALHGAAIASVPASGGLLVWPHVVRSLRRADGARVVAPTTERRRVLDRGAARALAQMMVRTTTIGSGRRGFVSRRGRPYLDDVAVGGKTGSLARKNPYLHYSWFVGFAPAKRPEIAFAVLLGNPAKWRIKASTAARVLVASYLERKRAATSKAP